MMRARFGEIESGLEVVAETLYGWGDQPDMVLVTYTLSREPLIERRYAVEKRKFERHFTLVPNQEIAAQAFGNTCERPTAKQKEIDDAALLEWARAVKRGG